MPKQIQNPIVGQALQRAFGLQGRVDPALDEVVTPVVVLGDLQQNTAPDAALAASAFIFQSAVAGQNFTVRFEIPGNMLAQIHAVHIRPATASPVRVKFSNTGPAQANVAEKSLNDGRLIEAGISPAAVVTYGTQAAALANSQLLLWAPTDGLTWEPLHAIVGSGLPNQFGFLELQVSTVNVSCYLGIEWKEYRQV